MVARLSWGTPTGLLVLLVVASAQAAEWNTGVGGNAARDGRSSFIGPGGPEILWEESLPAIVSQQAVIGGGILVLSRIGSFDIPTGTWIVAHDLATGDILWQTQLPYDFPGTSWRSKTSAILNGHVYATRAGNTNLDFLYALDETDGSIVWQSEDLIDEGTTESLAFDASGDLIVGNFQSLLRIDKDTGDTVWSVPRTCPTSSGCAAAVFDDRVYIWEASPMGPVVTAFDIADGARRYSSKALSAGIAQQVGLMVGPDGTVYAPRTQNNPITDFFVALTDTGTAFVEKWRVPMGYTPFASFAVGPDGTVYTYTAKEEIIRLDPDTGAVLDTSAPIAGDFFSPRIAVDAAGKVFLTNGSFTGSRFYSFDADLTLRWDEAIPNVNLGGPAIGPGGIVVVCGTGAAVRAYGSRPCPADVDGSGAVDFADLLDVLTAWGASGVSEDIDGSGVVDFGDLLAVLTAWGDCPM